MAVFVAIIMILFMKGLAIARKSMLKAFLELIMADYIILLWNLASNKIS